jgi:hypothetical protein
MIAISIRKITVCTRGYHEKYISTGIPGFGICHSCNTTDNGTQNSSGKTYNSPINIFAVYSPKELPTRYLQDHGDRVVGDVYKTERDFEIEAGEMTSQLLGLTPGFAGRIRMVRPRSPSA